MYNDCSFIGSMGADPEVRATKDGGSFTTFSMAVNKPGSDDKPLWLNVTTFGKTGEFVGKYLKKGNLVLAQGTLELQEYEGKDGKNHSSLRLLANKIVSLTKREGQANGAAASATPSVAKPAAVADEDIPF